jgi:AAA+ superfamily predicted ATPase
MLAKAVANHTTAAFIRVVGSEFVQKYLGEVCFACPGGVKLFELSLTVSFICMF